MTLASPAVWLTWHKDALCADRDPDMWFPAWNQLSAKRHAIEVCQACPVQLDCLEYALVTGQTEGIWGGLTPKQRFRLSPQSDLGPAPTDADGFTHGTDRASRRHSERLEMPCVWCAQYRRSMRARRADLENARHQRRMVAQCKPS